MNIEILEKCIENGNYLLDFEEDGIGMTWGVSYFRFVIGDKSKFRNIEQFFLSTLKSKNNWTSGIYGQPKWIESVDLINWTRNLKQQNVGKIELNAFVKYSVENYQENLKYWEKENTINISKFKENTNFKKVLKITETIFPRHIINSTEIYLTESDEKYYLYEGNDQS